jgi:hypothetical protein
MLEDQTCSLGRTFTTSIIDNHIQTTKVIVCLLYRPLHGGFIAIHLCIPVCNLAIQKTLPYFKSTNLAIEGADTPTVAHNGKYDLQIISFIGKV